MYRPAERGPQNCLFFSYCNCRGAPLPFFLGLHPYIEPLFEALFCPMPSNLPFLSWHFCVATLAFPLRQSSTRCPPLPNPFHQKRLFLHPCGSVRGFFFFSPPPPIFSLFPCSFVFFRIKYPDPFHCSAFPIVYTRPPFFPVSW